MKVTLAIVVVVLTSATLHATTGIQSPQQSAPAAQEQAPPAAGDGTPQQQGTPPSLSKPCTESKDTCEIEPTPQQPTAAPSAKAEQRSSDRKPSTTPAPHSKKSRHRKTPKKQAALQDPPAPKKIVVRQGGTSAPTVVLTPGATAQGNFTPQMTAELLSATDANLKEVASKPLSATQAETVNQIRLFMEQANAAVKAGDLDRGHNLAIKAHLLSDDLVKH